MDFSSNKLTNNIARINNSENPGFEINENNFIIKKFYRRNNAALPSSINFHKDFSDFNQKMLKFNISSKNEIYQLVKIIQIKILKIKGEIH